MNCSYKASDKPNSRIDVADILRGIAIAGIILIHFIEHMNFYSFPEATSAFWAKMNQAVWDSTFFLLAGKMYAIFAMLFGLSFYIQHDNQAQKGIDFRPRFVWRMILLMLFGLFDLLFYNGDILFLYAVCGFLIIPFIRASDKIICAAILVLMLQGDQVVNKRIKLPVSLTEMDLKLLSALLNATMTEITVEEFTEELLDKVMRSAGDAASLVPVIVDFTTEALRGTSATNMAVAGQMRLLGQPEYRDVDKAQRVLTSLDEDTLSNLPAVMQNQNGTQVLVGPENVARELKDTSVVMTKFDIGDGMQAMIGVVGPTRMDYAKVTARLSYFAESLSKMFAKPEQMQLPEPVSDENKEA